MSETIHSSNERTLAMDILAGMPVECRSCIHILPQVEAMAYWVNDGRVTALNAGQRIMEMVGCTAPTNYSSRKPPL